MDISDFLEAAGLTQNGWKPDFAVPFFVEKLLEIGEIEDSVTKIEKLDSILPVWSDGETHPLYWICLCWFEGVGLIERQPCEGGLQDFELTDFGKLILQGLRDRRDGFH